MSPTRWFFFVRYQPPGENKWLQEKITFISPKMSTIPPWAAPASDLDSCVYFFCLDFLCLSSFTWFRGVCAGNRLNVALTRVIDLFNQDGGWRARGMHFEK